MTHRPATRAALAATLMTLVAAVAPAATERDHPWCGTGKGLNHEKLAVHRWHQEAIERERAEPGSRFEAARSLPEAARVGDVAVLVDDGNLIVRRNDLDLDGFGVELVQGKKGTMTALPFDGEISDDVGEPLSLTDDSAVAVAFPRTFKFPFYGPKYKGMFVHSDGNVSFKAADAASTDRSLSRLLGGPPRIAALFADLNPETATVAGAGVFVRQDADRVVVTWRDVPTFGSSDRNTTQLTLFKNGRITIVWGEIGTLEAVVGVSPGGGAGAQLVDMTAGLPSPTVKKGAIAERFRQGQEVDDFAVGQAFFREFADDYDILIVWLGFNQSLGGAFAYEFTVKNEIEGIGAGVFDISQAMGSKGRMRAFVQMGALSRYPADPHQLVPGIGTNSTMDVLGQEAGHRWAAHVRFMDGNGEHSHDLLGRDESHWSSCHDTLASDMEGNAIQDQGGGRFLTTESTERFSPLDQYLMGLRGPEDVPPFFYATPCPNPARGPEENVNINGSRVDVTIDQVIAAEGPRVPPASRAPKVFNMAFVLLSEGEPSAEQVAHVDAIRAAWEEYFPAAVDFNGDVDTTLRPRRGRK
jgi:hypothetical protein